MYMDAANKMHTDMDKWRWNKKKIKKKQEKNMTGGTLPGSFPRDARRARCIWIIHNCRVDIFGFRNIKINKTKMKKKW